MPLTGEYVGQNIAKERYRRGWTQDQLVAKLNAMGCYLTVSILASMETRRCTVSVTRLMYLARVFGVIEQDLLPKERPFSGQPVGLVHQTPRHRRRKTVAQWRRSPGRPKRRDRT